MGKLRVLIGLIALLVAIGCGGSGGGGHFDSGRGDVSGIVFDENGDIVRDATVSFGNRNTVQTNSSGVYVLTDLPADYVDLVATIRQNGVSYVGENVALVQNGERTKDVNIALYRQDSVASMQGQVTDRQGRPVVGVHIFLRPASSTLQTSAVTVSDNNGFFFIGSLKSNSSYNVQVNALGYNGDQDTITLTPGENRTVNFVLHDPVVTNVPKPTNLVVNAYTSPLPSRGDARQVGAVEMMKQKLNPKRSTAKSRILSPNNIIEMDLFWDPIAAQYQSALLGFGIYRSANGGANLHNTDFLRDPLAQFYPDIDDALSPGQTYTYGITSLDTLFDGSQGESSMSNTAAATPLGGLNINSVTATANPTITWQSASGAATYAVYLFNQFPGIGVADFFDTSTSRTANTTFTYSATNLVHGQTYYAMVVGFSSDSTAFSISPVTSFTVQ